MWNKNYLKGAIIAIILGLLTNAIWDALKPLTVLIFKSLLNLSILGVESFKNGIYREIAMGFHEDTALQIYLMINALVLGLVITVIIFTFLVRRRKSKPLGAMDDRGSVFKIFTSSGFGLFMVVYCFFFLTLSTLEIVKRVYINKAVTHFYQVFQVITPYISEDEGKVFNSLFSQINSKNDYSSLIDSLEIIAKDKDLKIPDFDFTF